MMLSCPKISIDYKEDENDNVVDSILSKDDNKLSKIESVVNIATLIEKLESLELQESRILKKKQ